MAKPIVLNENQINEMIEQYKAELKKARSFDGKIKIEKAVGSKQASATIIYSQKAWIKQSMLVSIFKKEVAWHGTVSRLDDTTFYIEDIFCYPQDVSSVTVDVDEKYAFWRDNLDDEVCAKMLMQGHSHVNMAVIPSGTDMDTRRRMLNALFDDQFYIFVIANKECEISAEIYDLHTNTLYEDKDIEVEIDGFELFYDFVDDALGMVTDKPAYAYKSATAASKSSQGRSTASPVVTTTNGAYTPSSSAPSKGKTYSFGSEFADDDDDDEFPYNYGYPWNY